jgi:flagellar hook-associated protein 3 FlgL
MNYVSVGDMAQAYQLRQHNVQLKTTLTQLTEEVVTGVQTDIGRAVGGDFTALAAIDHSLNTLESYGRVATEAQLFSGTMQGALDLVQTLATEIGPSLVSAATNSSPTLVATTTSDAVQRFEAAISALNTNVAGRYVFSGNAVDTKPLAPADDILAALGTAISTETTVPGIVSAVEAWFSAPTGSGGFSDLAYAGSASALGAMRITEGEAIELNVTAQDATIRDTLMGFALAALVSADMVPSGSDVRSGLTQAAGERLITADSNLTVLRAKIGATEGRIADAQVENRNQSASLKLARQSLIEADPYDTATALEAVKTQIETLYKLTSRLSALSLADYL